MSHIDLKSGLGGAEYRTRSRAAPSFLEHVDDASGKRLPKYVTRVSRTRGPGIPGRRLHDTPHTFISLARRDGAMARWRDERCARAHHAQTGLGHRGSLHDVRLGAHVRSGCPCPAQPSSEPGEAIVGPKPTAADIALQCQQSGGSGCEEGAFISRNAATCLAQTSSVAEGERPWEVSLGYYDNHKRVGWLIMTVAGSTRDGGYWGDAVVLDATTGGELSRSTYTATP